MATYDHLPVYKASYDLLLELFKIGKNFSREYRYTVGEDIKHEVMRMMIGIYRANRSIEERRVHIGEARENLERVRLLLRILKDLKQVGLDRFVSVNEKVESVSKQLIAWERSCPVS